MHPSPSLNTKRLTWLYVLALSMVAMLTIVGQFAVQRALRQLEGDAGIVNIAGRQRMLSQRLPRLVLAIQQRDLSDQRRANQQELSRTIALWELSQRALEHGSTELALPGRNSQAVLELFQGIESHFVAVRDCVNKLITEEPASLSSQFSSTELHAMLDHSDAFLLGMDRIVSQYAREAELRVSRLQWTERGLLAATLAVLLCEGFLVFWPAVSSLQRTFDQLQAVTQQLSQAKEIAESANRAKSTFLTRLSHELRTPLHAILGMLGLIRRRSLDRPQQRHLQLTHQAALTLQSLVNDLLEVAELEAEIEPKFNYESMKVPSLIQGAIELMRPIASKKQLRMESEVDPEFPDWISGDPNRLRQIVYNLLQNAIRYTDQGLIQCKCLVDKNAEPSQYILEFSDTGCGIAPENQARIFESFERVESHLQVQPFGHGLGLGLPITVSLVKAMGGYLTMESQIDRGTRIAVHLPLHPTDPKRSRNKQTKRRTVADQARPWALVVDDSKANRILMRNYLKRLGFRTSSASNQEHALQKCWKLSPILVILDKHLQDEDGLELITRLRNSMPEKIPSVYLVTADVYCHSDDLMSRYGISAVLHKPLKFNELKRALSPTSSILLAIDEFSELRNHLQRILLAQFPADLSTLAKQIDSHDFQGIGLLAHRIRGGAANAGLQEIVLACSDLENKAASTDLSGCTSSFKVLSEAIDQLLRIVR